jgi:hypothetical protein
MGFFAISSRGSTANFSVEACHITLWVLPNHRFKVRTGDSFFFDVGLRILAKDDLNRIRITLPFSSDVGVISDLSKFVLNPDFAPLIFGVPVSVKDDLLAYDGAHIGQGGIQDRVVPVSAKRSSPEARSGDRFSVWNIELNDLIKKDQPSYIRFRITLSRPGTLWTSKGWGFAKSGMIADLRVCDIREYILLGLGQHEAPHIVPIARLFLFLGAPSYYVPNHFSPPLHYSRLLEPEVWRPYLEGRYDRHTRITIHQWRSTQVVDADRPFRAYMDLSREFGRELWMYYILGGLVIPIAVHAWGWFGTLIKPTAIYAWDWLLKSIESLHCLFP